MNKRVIICTAKYSDNLGDGVISDSVEYLIKNIHPNCEVLTLDISGRTHYDDSDSTDTTLVKKIFLNTPEALRPLVTLTGWHLIFKPRLTAEINRIDFAKCGLLIFGGGQLINDIALNFPLKLAYIAKQAQLQGLPYSINAVGVGQKFSNSGKKLFHSIFNSSSLSSIYLRDQESIVKYNSVFSSKVAPSLTIDSGLWAKECYNLQYINTHNNNTKEKPRVGVGISHPKELAAHSSEKNSNSTAMIKFWVEVTKHLLQNNLIPVLFTNGSRDDHLFMTLVIAELSKLGILKNIEISDRFKKPNQLVETISSFSAVVSHRLHANIISHSLNIPSIALAWDKKVQSYFDLIERSEWCFADTTPPEKVVTGLLQAMHLGLNQQKIHDLKMITIENLKVQTESIN